MPKLTLSVDPAVVRRAKRYAARRKTSVSRLVAAFLDALSRPVEPVDAPPVLRRLRGSLKGAKRRNYRDHLGRKYR
jgi:hypothetical protein